MLPVDNLGRPDAAFAGLTEAHAMFTPKAGMHPRPVIHAPTLGPAEGSFLGAESEAHKAYHGAAVDRARPGVCACMCV